MALLFGNMIVMTCRFDTKITAKSLCKGRERRKIEGDVGGRGGGTPGTHGEGRGRALLFKVFTSTHNVQK